MLKVKLEPGLRIGRDGLYTVPAELLQLLKAIHEHGSLLRAIEDVEVSYRHAWGLLGRWEAITGHKLAVLTRGHGTALTLFGNRLAQAAEWLDGRMSAALPALERDLVRHFDIPTADEAPRIRLNASNDIALLKLKERLQSRMVIDLRFEGSIHSLDSLARGDCEIAGFHMPDPPALLGDLVAEFRRRLHGVEHLIALLFARHQGLIVRPGAKPRIRGLADLARPGIRFVNREPGSGTRLLFDALLARESMGASAIQGYDHEEFTHMATAATVRAGMADVAFGIEAAARAHGLRFVPVVTENYYLVCRRNSPARIALETMVSAAQSPSFHRVVSKIGGYEFAAAGRRARLSQLFAGRPAAK
jgi:molybdate transport repressor ModE-like protein